MPRVLVACEMSGRVRTQFALRGWEAWSADLLPDETHIWNKVPHTGDLGQHYQGDVLDIIRDNWDLVIAHPPCTDLSQAGARYWAQKQADGRQLEAAEFFMQMYRLPRKSAWVVVENPVGFMGLKDGVFRPPDQVVQPWWFGDPLAKTTCLWYRPSIILTSGGLASDRLDDLKPTHTLADYPDGVNRTVTGGGSWRTDKKNGKTGMNRAWEDSQGRNRRHILRSLTPEGFAKACADQWGPYVESRRT